MASAARRIAACLFGIIAAAPARAEIGVTVSVESDDRYRGKTYSSGRPVTALALAYDDARGPYVGVTATATFSRPELISIQEYAGYALRTASGTRLDVGVTNYDYTRYYSLNQAETYYEVYAGIGNRRVSAHVYYSPNYIGLHYASVYFDLGAVARPSDKWRVIGHLGYVATLDRPPFPLPPRGSYDWRASVVRRVGKAELQLAWDGSGPYPDFYDHRPQHRSAFVAGGTFAF